MPQMIPDGFEREPAVQQIRGIGVAQSMRPALRAGDVQALQQRTGQMIKRASRQSTKRRMARQEQFLASALGPRFFEVTLDGFARSGGQRMFLHTSRFAAPHPQDAAGPIDVFQAQASDLSAPKSIDRQQEQYRPIAQMEGRGPIVRRDEPPHIRPGWPQRQVFLAKQARGENGWRPISPPPALLISIVRKAPQDLGCGGQTHPAQWLGGKVSHKPIHHGEGDLAQGHLLLLQPLQEALNPPTRNYGRCFPRVLLPAQRRPKHSVGTDRQVGAAMGL